MGASFENVYNSVYVNEEFWKNDLGSGLWTNKTVCLLGFNDAIASCRELLLHLMKSLVLRGASVLKYPNRKLDVRKISINYYLCNYSLGYESRPPNSVDYKLATPIWLLSCNRDNRVYATDTLPIFRANKQFNCLKFAGPDLKVSLLGSFTGKPGGTTSEAASNIKYSFDTLHRFIVHCGLKFVEPSELRSRDFKIDGRLYLLFCKTFDESIDDHILNLSLNLPCLSIEWLFDSYMTGELKDIKSYLVSLQRYSKPPSSNPLSDTKSQLKKRKSVKRNYANKVLCFSFGFAVENELHNVDLKDFGATAAYVVNPIFTLAPWALKTSNQSLKKTYNNISLVEEDRLLLFISKEESKFEGRGLFGELSLLVENTVRKSGKNLVRNIRIYDSLNTSSSNLLEVPFELLDGKKLSLFDRNANVNLYDLADSITFMDVDSLPQYQDEAAVSQNTQELHEMVENFSNGLRESEMRWLQLTRSE